MDNERVRKFCLGLPHARETVNWGHMLVFWVGDREIGGKMFAMLDLEGTGRGRLLFHCGAERFDELLETEGIIPAPHLARAHWVALERRDVLKPGEIESELRRAHDLICEKLPKRTKDLLEMTEKDRARATRADKKPAEAGKSGSTSRCAGKSAGSSAQATTKDRREPPGAEVRMVGQDAGVGARERR